VEQLGRKFTRGLLHDYGCQGRGISQWQDEDANGAIDEDLGAKEELEDAMFGSEGSRSRLAPAVRP
jgi:hypothetical protein